MLCGVCKEGIEGIWDPSRTKRLERKEKFLERRNKHCCKTYQFSFSGDDEDLRELQPSECVFAHHENQASLVASLRDRCTICHDLMEMIPEICATHNYDSKGYLTVFYIHYPDHSVIQENYRLLMDIYTETSKKAMSLYYVKEDAEPDCYMNYKHEVSNESPRTWSFIGGWMKKCTESHQACRQLESSTSYRPTRLLEIDGSNSFRLLMGSECPTVTRYAALSYCWGQKPAHTLLRLLRSTLSDLREWRPIYGLPKTFRDAMQIAKRLGVSYMWIDRLCIFQDSAEDWRHEASTMQDVYRNAYIGIGALSAEDDDGGCFFRRDTAKVGPTLLSLKLERGGQMLNFICQGDMLLRSWRHTFENEPLCQRSWVVQERLLAPRTLYFGSKQVFWECRAETCCEMHPKGMDFYEGKARETSTKQLWKQLLATRREEASRLSNRSQLFVDWDVIVEHYASLQLTKASDKLVALSGLANDMKRRLNELQPGPHRYLAGLWKDELMTQLTWYVRGPAKRVSQYRAPSWSWACLDGELQPGTMATKLIEVFDLASMISAEMVYPSNEETGEVKSGILTLEGPHMWSKLRPVGSDQPRHSFVVLPSSAHMPMVVIVRFDTLSDVTEEVLLLWTCWHKFNLGPRIVGLALAMTENDCYRRLGSMTSNSRGEEDLEFIKTLPQTQVNII